MPNVLTIRVSGIAIILPKISQIPVNKLLIYKRQSRLMMEKIQLMVLGLSASPANNNAYALILKEMDGTRRLPIIIGAFEAQAIALELEGVTPPRPMTHDLLKSLIDSFGASLTEVCISELREGTFYAKLIFEDFGFELDARPSDAIALAVRCNAPIYVGAEVMDETGVNSTPDDEFDAQEDDEARFIKNKKESIPTNKAEQLQKLLDKAINDEDYEKAAKLRDEIRKISL
jgi:bifunctional DNase/RNase